MNYTLAKKKKSAFTLIEVMIALSIIITAVLSITTLTIQTIKNNKKNINNITAQYFASQGLEAIREIRDSNVLQNQYWLTAHSSSIFGENLDDLKEEGEYFSVNSNEIINETTGPWKLKQIDSTTNDDSVKIENTNFKRHLFIKPVYEDSFIEKIYIESVVTWNENENEKTLKLFTLLTNWQE